jgi:hypothetical protein
LSAQNLHLKALGLAAQPLCQFSAADRFRETRVVLDFLSDASLTTNAAPVNDKGIYSLSSSVETGGQPGRASTHNYKVIIGSFGLAVDAQLVGQFSIAGFH